VENLVARRLGGNLRELRRAVGMGQGRLAELLTELGVPMRLNTISRMENGTRVADIVELLALAIALNVSPARLLLPPTADADREVALTPTAAVQVPETTAWLWAVGNDPLPDGDVPADVPHVDPWDYREQNMPFNPPNRTMVEELNWHRGALQAFKAPTEQLLRPADGNEPVPRRVLAAYLREQALIQELEAQDEANVDGENVP
jgi:transcriptional regulator with XRE-family HTH domain